MLGCVLVPFPFYNNYTLVVLVSIMNITIFRPKNKRSQLLVFLCTSISFQVK